MLQFKSDDGSVENRLHFLLAFLPAIPTYATQVGSPLRTMNIFSLKPLTDFIIIMIMPVIVLVFSLGSPCIQAIRVCS